MEAKEIVEQEVARQADFGYAPSWEDFVIAGRVAGIKEVVETTIYLALANGYVSIRELFELHEEGQAKLKEWGL